MHPKRKLFQKRKSNKRDKKRTTRKSKRSTQKAKRSMQKAKRGGAPGDYITEKDFNDIVGQMRPNKTKIQVTYSKPQGIDYNYKESFTKPITGIFTGSCDKWLYITVEEYEGKHKFKDNKQIQINEIKNGGIKILKY
jgi:hypothetical protein